MNEALLRWWCVTLCTVSACARGAPASDGERGRDAGAVTTTGGSGGSMATGGTHATGGTSVPPPPPPEEDAGHEQDAAIADAGTDAGEATPITDVPFWIEALETDTRAVFWVKVDINAGEALDLILRYGDASLASASNIGDVFVFGDDFSGAAVDTTKWTIDDMTGWSVSGGQLHGTNTSGRIRSMTTFTSNTAPVVAETRFKVTTLPGAGFMGNGFFTSTSVSFGLLVNGNPANYYVRTNATWSAAMTWTGDYVTNWSRIVARMKSGAQADMILQHDADGANLVTLPYPYTVSGAPLALGKRYDDTNAAQPYDAVWDFIFVRKWVATEPTVTVDTSDTKNGLCADCYDKTITIDNTAGMALSGHQVRIALDSTAAKFWSHVGAAGDDIRIGTP